jgi:hypothetical protein
VGEASFVERCPCRQVSIIHSSSCCKTVCDHYLLALASPRCSFPTLFFASVTRFDRKLLAGNPSVAAPTIAYVVFEGHLKPDNGGVRWRGESGWVVG